MLQVHSIESYHVEVAPLARPQGMRRYQATATRPGHPPLAIAGYSVAEVLMRMRLRIYAPEETAQPETVQPETARPRQAKAVKARKKTGRKTGRKTRKKPRARPRGHRETAAVRQTRGADDRYVSKSGLPPGTDLSASVYFARGAHPEERLWFRTPEGSSAPYVPSHRSAP